MEHPAFFTRLRAKVLKLRDATETTHALGFGGRRPRGQPLMAARWSDPGSRVGEPIFGVDRDGRVAAIDELMTQAMLGAGIAITPGETARLVWVPLLVEYGKKTDSRKLTTGEITSVQRVGEGNIIARSTSTSTDITDLFGLAAAYLEHLKTLATAAEHQRAEPHQAPVITEESSRDGDEQSRKKARHAFVEPRLEELHLSILEWAQQSKPQVAYNTVRGYMDGRTRRLRPNTRTVLAQTLRVTSGDLPD